MVLSQQCSTSILAFPLQSTNLLVQLHDELVGPVNGGHQSGPLPLPSFQAINLGASTSEFGFNLLAEATLVVVVLSHINELHSACFAGAILVIAPMGEAGPAPVSTGETLLVVKTHAYQMR
jgi:hypothetical protein